MLDPICNPNCIHCHGEGYLERPYTHLNERTVMYRYRCRCATGMPRFRKQIPAGLHELSFDKFPAGESAVNAQAASLMRRLVEGLGCFTKAPVVVLSGPEGAPTTHAAAMAVREAMCEGKVETAMIESAANLVAEAAEPKQAKRRSRRNQKPDALEVGLLVIVELGFEYDEDDDRAGTTLYRILETRARKGLATIITTELTDEELDELYGDSSHRKFLSKLRAQQQPAGLTVVLEPAAPEAAADPQAAFLLAA